MRTCSPSSRACGSLQANDGVACSASKMTGAQKIRTSMTIDERGRDVADRWFLARGMPAVLTSRARWRHLLSRSAPALAAYATIVTALLVAYFLIGTSEIYIDAPRP